MTIFVSALTFATFFSLACLFAWARRGYPKSIL